MRGAQVTDGIMSAQDRHGRRSARGTGQKSPSIEQDRQQNSPPPPPGLRRVGPVCSQALGRLSPMAEARDSEVLKFRRALYSALVLRDLGAQQLQGHVLKKVGWRHQRSHLQCHRHRHHTHQLRFVGRRACASRLLWGRCAPHVKSTCTGSLVIACSWCQNRSRRALSHGAILHRPAPPAHRTRRTCCR